MSRTDSVPLSGVKGECDDGMLMDCSTELKYGMNDSLVFGTYTDSECTAMTGAKLLPSGCNGEGRKQYCSGGGTLMVAYLPHSALV